MKKITSKIIGLVVIISLSLYCAPAVFADGGLIAPPYRTVYETDQKAVVFYDGGYETLILSIAFSGNTRDFAWIVPTPTKPETGKSVDSLFVRLNEITQPQDVYYPQSGVGLYNALEGSPKGVTVVETKKIDYYDISVLEATDADALYNWLNDNGYQFPQAGKYITDDYIKKGWYFTAIKISQDDLSGLAQNQLQSGHATPLQLKFKTDRIVYPLKISSLSGIEDNSPSGQVTYIDGYSGKGVKIDSDKVLATDNVIKNFNIDDGKISFYLKKRNNESLGNIMRVEKAKSYVGQHLGFDIANYSQNKISINYWGRTNNTNAQIDLGSDFKENQWQKYEFIWSNANNKITIKFYIDGIERTVENSSWSSPNQIKSNEINEKAKIIIGGYDNYAYNTETQDYQRGRNSGGVEILEVPPAPPVKYYSGRSNDLLIDEITLNANQKQVFSAGFENNLEAGIADNLKDALRIYAQNPAQNNYNITRPRNMGILLYVFAEKRQDLTGFDTQFAGWMTKEDVENIARLDGKDPWIAPLKNKYYLTRFYKNMNISEMSEDLYPQDSKNQSPFNSPTGSEGSRKILLTLLIAASFISVIFISWMIIKREKKKEA